MFKKSNSSLIISNDVVLLKYTNENIFDKLLLS